jgi:hypothetical protein
MAFRHCRLGSSTALDLLFAPLTVNTRKRFFEEWRVLTTYFGVPGLGCARRDPDIRPTAARARQSPSPRFKRIFPPTPPPEESHRELLGVKGMTSC